MTLNHYGVVFPGQGSQSVGMLKDIARQNSLVEKIFEEASQVLNYDLWKLVSEGPAEELDKTTRTQPALLTASYALWKIFSSKKDFANPTLLAGHSLGEYTALVCANAMNFKEGVKLVAARGEYMQEAVPSGVGALAAIVGLSNEDVNHICQQSILENEVLSPANFNSPGQVVIAGNKSAVERAMILAKEKGAKLVKLLPVSVPSHCDLMKPAAKKLSALLETIQIQTPIFPVLSNVDVKIYQNADEIRDGLVRQLFKPVRWVDSMKFFAEQNIKTIFECGPGKVLTGLNKRIVPDIKLLTVTEETV